MLSTSYVSIVFGTAIYSVEDLTLTISALFSNPKPDFHHQITEKRTDV
jgi:hypothetical protein